MHVDRRTLRMARERKGWSQPEAAAEYGISASYLMKLEQGSRRNLNAVLVARIADKLGLYVADLTEDVIPAALREADLARAHRAIAEADT